METSKISELNTSKLSAKLASMLSDWDTKNAKIKAKLDASVLKIDDKLAQMLKG